MTVGSSKIYLDLTSLKIHLDLVDQNEESYFCFYFLISNMTDVGFL